MTYGRGLIRPSDELAKIRCGRLISNNYICIDNQNLKMHEKKCWQ